MRVQGACWSMMLSVLVCACGDDTPAGGTPPGGSGGSSGTTGAGKGGTAGTAGVAGKGGTAGASGGASGTGQSGTAGASGSQGGTGGSGGAGKAGASGSAGSAGMTGSGESKTASIDSKGGTIALSSGVTLTIPADALGTSQMITITETTKPAPAGYEAYSPVYKFEPEGLTFSKPLTITIPYKGDPQLATLFWSRQGTTGYDWLGGKELSGKVSGEVTHFSEGFIANGVDYTDPPDTSCVRSRLLDGRVLNPGGVSMFYTVDDCWGRPITGLKASDFIVKEDDVKLSSEVVAPVILPKNGQHVFVTLLLDMSSSTKPQLPALIAGAKSFVDRIKVEKLPLEINIGLFDRSQYYTQWQASTVDLDLVSTKLDELNDYTAPDPAGTNLHGAIVDSLNSLKNAESNFQALNKGGAMATGYVVVFTDGGDTAGWKTEQEAASAIAQSPNQLIMVGLQGEDYNPVALKALAPSTLLTVDDPAGLSKAFGSLATRIAGQLNRTYLLGYCSPKAGGSHVVSLDVKNSENKSSASFTFDAKLFGPGCSTQLFTDACIGKECGGLGCGACDDRTSVCDSATNQCVSQCVQANKCNGETITSYQGTSLSCTPNEDIDSCGTASCVKLNSDKNHCGDCTTVCGFKCFAGKCINVAQVSTGNDHTCALLSTGKVRCWGKDYMGSLGYGLSYSNTKDLFYPGGEVDVAASVSQISLGNSNSCALLNSGKVRCWGAYGQTTKFPMEGQTPATVGDLPVGGTFSQVANGEGMICLLSTTNKVRCWRAGAGDGGQDDLQKAPEVDIGSKVIQISAGGYHGCALLETGKVRCWGANSVGQLGYGNTKNIPIGDKDAITLAGDVDVGGVVTQVSTGGGHTCVLLDTGNVRCWGYNDKGQLGYGHTNNVGDDEKPSSVGDVNVGGKVKQISAGTSHTCALLETGKVRCWGSGDYANTLGYGNTQNIGDNEVPAAAGDVDVGGLVTQVSAGGWHTCVVMDTGNVRCWGYAQQGQLGYGNGTQIGDDETPASAGDVKF